jgi:hypothetical protein
MPLSPLFLQDVYMKPEKLLQIWAFNKYVITVREVVSNIDIVRFEIFTMNRLVKFFPGY